MIAIAISLSREKGNGDAKSDVKQIRHLVGSTAAVARAMAPR
jgi:hypothetical protein